MRLFSSIKFKAPPNDVVQFKRTLKRQFGGIFSPHRPILVARAPASLDILGGFTDYCGGSVICSTLEPAVIVGVQKRSDQRILIRLTDSEKLKMDSTVEIYIKSFYNDQKIRTCKEIQQMLRADKMESHIEHAVGILYVLLKEGLINNLYEGINLGISSNVANDLRISSLKALKVAIIIALKELLKFSLDYSEIAQLCELADNRIFGRNCGNSEYCITLGAEKRIVIYNCHSSEKVKIMDVPKGYRFVFLSTGVSRDHDFQKFIDARISMSIGRKILVDHQLQHDPDDWPFDGMLCNISLDEYRKNFARLLPVEIRGSDFLQKYQTLEDNVVTINSDKIYRIRSRVEHAIHENYREKNFQAILSQTKSWVSIHEIIEAGEIMYASHWSFRRRLGLGIKETDILVDLVRKAGSDNGLFGAKAIACDGGHAVAVLAKENTDNILKNIISQYYYQTGLRARLFKGSSPGAIQFGIMKMKIH